MHGQGYAMIIIDCQGEWLPGHLGTEGLLSWVEKEHSVCLLRQKHNRL